MQARRVESLTRHRLVILQSDTFIDDCSNVYRTSSSLVGYKNSPI